MEEHVHGDLFSDADAAYLQAQGLHVDREHGRVFYANGRAMAPSNVGAILSAGRQEGTLTKLAPVEGVEMTKAAGSLTGSVVMTAPGEH